jgi:hypothetical protein
MCPKLMVFFLLIGLCLPLHASEKVLAGYDPRVDIISENYEAGPFLIYDCEDKHWVCVLEEYYKECQEKRESDLLHQKVKVRCASVAEFPTKKACFQKGLFLTSQNQGTRFCIGNDWKQKEIKFN